MGDNDAETFANITRADYDFDDKAFTAISNEAKDFISALLIKRKEWVTFENSLFDPYNNPQKIILKKHKPFIFSNKRIVLVHSEK